MHAKGTFDVKLLPLADAHAEAAGLGRMSIDKQFHGDLEATSQGQMLSAMSSVKGSAGYVAMERVTGALAGRNGSFVLQHSATMDRGAPTLTVTVVPDSGTDELDRTLRHACNHHRRRKTFVRFRVLASRKLVTATISRRS